MLWHSVTAGASALCGLLALGRSEVVPAFGGLALLAIPFAAAWHEASHVLAARAVGARVWRVQLGPAGVDRTVTPTRLWWDWSSFVRWHVEVGDVSRASTLRAVLAGGPVGSLILALGALATATAGWSRGPSVVAAAIGAASLVIGVATLNPFDPSSDGRRWWTLGPRHPLRGRTLALQQLGECVLLDRSPAEWPREAIRASAAGDPQDGDDDTIAGRLFAYVAALADDAVEDAGRLISDVPVTAASPYAAVVAMERAYWSAVSGRDLTALNRLLSSGMPVPRRGSSRRRVARCPRPPHGTGSPAAGRKRRCCGPWSADEW